MSDFFKEARATLGLALPIIVGQVSQMLMGVTDSIMIGRLGAVPLAASAFAGGLFSVFYVVGIGLLMPVAVFVSREHGTGDERTGARWLQHGVVLAVLAGLVAMGGMAALAAGFSRMGQSPEVMAAVPPFYALITLSLLPVLVFQAFRQFAEALGRPGMPMLILLGSVVLNAGFNWVLIYGHLGAPALGLAGAGWATLIARLIALVAIILWLRRAEALRAAWLRGLVAAHFREMLRVGVPAAVMLFLEVAAFMVAALMMGRLGAAALAAHQIALTCVGFVFMVPLGLSMAVGMRISRAVGEGRLDRVRPITGSALMLTCGFMSLTAVTFWFGGTWLAHVFVSDPAVVALAARLLVIAAIFELFDGAQVIGSGSLRGLTDVRVPAAITFVAYWLLAIPGGYLLGLHTSLGPLGIWIGLAAGLAIAAVLLGARFIFLTRGQGVLSPNR